MPRQHNRCELGRKAQPAVRLTRELFQPTKPSVLYFAYGSNLDDRRMRARCPSAVATARAVLPNYELIFRGYSRGWGGAVASVVRAASGYVEGLLFRLDRADLRVLDCFEGHPVTYTRVSKYVIDEHGRKHRASLYMQPEDEFFSLPPAPKYIAVIRRAYRRLGFDIAALTRAEVTE